LEGVSVFLGIEIGGTKLQLGLGAGDGVLKGLWRGGVDVAAGAEGIRRQITAAVPELLGRAGVERAQVRGLGIGFGGPVDDRTHTVIKSHQIEGWDNFPLADWMGELLGWPAALGNDADVAGLAEALFGAGKGLSPIFYITIGSGIGGGLVIDGEIYRGCGRGAAEIGHLRISQQSVTGVWRSPLEEVASGWAIEQEARTQAHIHNNDYTAMVIQLAGGDPSLLTLRHMARAAEQGDAFVWEVLRPAWESLAEGICHVLALLCPRRIVIGGGVSLMGEELLFKPLRQLVAERVFKPFAGCYDIVPAALGEEVVVHGALALARKRLSG
jgi:glucokinase